MTEDTTPTEGTPDDAPDDALAFDAVPIADLAPASSGANAASIALGTALLAVANATTAARDRLRFATRPEAMNRAAVLRRGIVAAGGAPEGFRVSTRIIAGDDGFGVAILLVAKTEPKGKGKGK